MNINDFATENSRMELIVTAVNSSLFSGIVYSLCFIFDSLIAPNIKDRFVFLWWNKPGEIIFSRMQKCKIDDRFTVKDAEEKYSSIFSKIQMIKDEKEKRGLETVYGIAYIGSTKMNKRRWLSNEIFCYAGIWLY